MNTVETLDYVIENLHDCVQLKPYGLLNWVELIQNNCKYMSELNNSLIDDVVIKLLGLNSENWATELKVLILELEGLKE